MLVEFAVENYRSFKEMQVLSLQATAQKESELHQMQYRRLHPARKNLNLLKTKAVFGANASGKSNVILAMAAFWKILAHNLGNETMLPKWVEPFRLDLKTVSEPSFFQIIIVVEGIKYRYGFAADKKRIHEEWLYKKDKKEIELFIREGNEITSKNLSGFEEINSILKKENNLFKENTLVLSVLNALNGRISKIIYENVIKSIMVNSGEEKTDLSFWRNESVRIWKKDEGFQRFVRRTLKSVDDTISDFEIKKEELNLDGFDKGFSSDFLIVKRKLDGEEVLFNLERDEGKGTQKVFALSSSIYEALIEGKTLFIDEFDARLHPRLTREIVMLFQSEEAHPEAQLIFVTHDSNLLDATLLRRDQITFAEKNKSGASKLFDLSDIKGVRENDLFEKNYLKGRYGGMPYLNNFQNQVFHA